MRLVDPAAPDDPLAWQRQERRDAERAHDPGLEVDLDRPDPQDVQDLEPHPPKRRYRP